MNVQPLFATKNKVFSLLVVLLPSIWMLLTNSMYMKWNYGGFALLGSIILFFISRTSIIREHIKFPFSFLYISLVIWSIYQFASLVSSRRDLIAGFLMLYDLPFFRFIFNFILISLIGYGLFFLIKYTRVLKSKQFWRYLIIHSLLLAITLWVAHFKISNEQCVGVFFTTMNMPCVISDNTYYLFVTLGAIVVLFLPTVLSLYCKHTEFYGYLLVLLSIMPLWIDAFFYPFQSVGLSVIELGRQNPSVFVTMSDIVSKSSLVTIVFFMLLVPLFFCLLNHNNS